MSKYMIRFSEIENSQMQMSILAKSLQEMSRSLLNISGNMDSQQSSLNALKNNLRKQSNNTLGYGNLLNQYGTLLSEIHLHYANTEEFLVNDFENWNQGINGMIVPGIAGASVGFTRTENEEWKKVLGVVKWVNKGAVALAGWLRYEDNLQKFINFLPKAAKNVNWKQIFGSENAIAGAVTKLKQHPIATWVNNFKGSFSKSVSDGFKDFAKPGLKSALKWAGVAISAITNGFQNYDEYKSGSIDGTRAVKETIVETVVDVVKGVVITAGITAVIAACTAGAAAAAPALAVTAVVVVGTVLVSGALDLASNALVQKNFSEAVSDVFLDSLDSLEKAKKYVYDQTGKTLKEAFNSAVNCFNNPIKLHIPWASNFGFS